MCPRPQKWLQIAETIGAPGAWTHTHTTGEAIATSGRRGHLYRLMGKDRRKGKGLQGGNYQKLWELRRCEELGEGGLSLGEGEGTVKSHAHRCKEKSIMPLKPGRGRVTLPRTDRSRLRHQHSPWAWCHSRGLAFAHPPIVTSLGQRDHLPILHLPGATELELQTRACRFQNSCLNQHNK